MITIKEYCPKCKTLRPYFKCVDVAYTSVVDVSEPYERVFARCASCRNIIQIPEFEEATDKNKNAAEQVALTRFRRHNGLSEPTTA